VAGVAQRETGAPMPTQILSRAYPSEKMICWPVSVRVGNVKNTDPSLIEPIAAA